MRAAVLLGGRRAWCVEAHLGRFAFGWSGHFEELARLEAEHVGKDVGRELLNFGVEVAHHGVVVAPRVLHGVLDLGERILKRSEAFDGAELRVGLGKRKEALQRAGEHVFRLSLVTGAGRVHCAVARVDDRFECALFVARIAFHGFHEVGYQVVAALQLNVDIRPGIVDLHFQPHQAVVHPDRENNEQNEEAQNDYAGHRRTSHEMEYLPTACSSFHCSQYTWRLSGCKEQETRGALKNAMEADNTHGGRTGSCPSAVWSRGETRRRRTGCNFARSRTSRGGRNLCQTWFRQILEPHGWR